MGAPAPPRWGAGPGYREDQALDAEAALRAYTCGAAAAAGEPGGGIIAVGAPAELTVFGGDPVACAVDELPDLPIVATVVGGAVVHRSADA